MKSRWLGLVLAAGKGTRMESDLAKVLHRVKETTLLGHVLNLAAALPIEKTIVVVGHQAADVEAAHAAWKVGFALQEPQLGTGHAVMAAAPELRSEMAKLDASLESDQRVSLLVLYGDVPLLRARTLRELMERHDLENAGVTVLSARVRDPKGYGRIIRGADGRFARITEDRDLTAAQRPIDEINSGIYTFALAPLLEALGELRADNAQKEYYLTDTLEIMAKAGHGVSVFLLDDEEEISGINTKAQLLEAEAVLDRRERSGDQDGCEVCTLLRTRPDLVLERHGELVLALAPHPYNAGHLWIFPDRHLVSFESLVDREGRALWNLAARGERWLEEAFHPQGFNQGYNSGRAGQHLVMQVIPRWSGDANFMPLIAGVNLLPESIEGTRARLLEARARMDAAVGDSPLKEEA